MRGLRAGLAIAGISAIATLTGAFVSPASAQLACTDTSFSRDIGAAAGGKMTADQLVGLYGRLKASGACPSVAFCVGRKAATAYTEQAYGLVGRPTPDYVGAKALLEQSRDKKLGEPWQLLVLLGDIDVFLARQAGNKAQLADAARKLQFAMNEMVEPSLCPDFAEDRPGPGSDELKGVRKRASAAVLLASQLVTPTTRKGECGGIFLATTRGIAAEPVPVPITFDFKSAALSDSGRKVADDLLQCLQKNKMTDIVLSGHTDSVGSDAYNMDLSAQRLASVQSYLRSNGYTGTIRAVPKGLRDPFVPDDPTSYTKDERD